MPPVDLQWIEMVDFSAGIFSNNNLAGGINVTSDNPCKAQPTGTYRCRSLPTGGLGPMPRIKEEFTLTTPPGDDADSVYRVCGLSTFGSVFVDPLVDTDQTHRAEVHLALDFYEPNQDDRYLVWIRETIYNDTPATETILSREFLNFGGAGTARYAYFNRTRMRTSLPLSPGQPVTTLQWALNPIGASDTNRISRAFPDPDDPTTNSTQLIGDEGEAYVIAIAHQGRLVLGIYQAWDRGVDTGIFSNENFVWTDVNLPTLESSDAAVFVPELDQSVTDMASMSANALFVVKRLGGGYVLQGSLGDVTVVQLPNVMCPDGSDYVRGANSPIGFIYSAGDAGMYVWNGGDSSRAVSPQLDAKAFTGGITLDGANGQCDRWQDLFLCPRNWVLDLKTESWWQIEDPAIFEAYFWSTSQSKSQTYGAPGTFEAADTAFALFQMDELAYSYSWRSHPLWLTRDRYITIRQGVAALQGHGQVTITVRDGSADDADQKFIVIDVDSDEIHNYRFDLSLSSENLVVDIQSDGAGSEAPLVHRLFLGYDSNPSHLPNYANEQSS